MLCIAIERALLVRSASAVRARLCLVRWGWCFASQNDFVGGTALPLERDFVSLERDFVAMGGALVVGVNDMEKIKDGE